MLVSVSSAVQKSAVLPTFGDPYCSAFMLKTDKDLGEIGNTAHFYRKSVIENTTDVMAEPL
jgi:hypothetical protein